MDETIGPACVSYLGPFNGLARADKATYGLDGEARRHAPGVLGRTLVDVSRAGYVAVFACALWIQSGYLS